MNVIEGHFNATYGDFGILLLSNLVQFGPFKSVLGSFVRAFDENMAKNMHHTTETQNFTFDLF